MPEFIPDPFITPQLSPAANRDNLNSSSRRVEAARQRFLAQHGPAALQRPRQTTSREVRKALLAAEMARWESFRLAHSSPSTPGYENQAQ